MKFNYLSFIFTRFTVFKLVLGFLLFSVFSQSQADDLVSIYKLAISNDPQYKAADAEYNALKEEKPQGFSALLPQISVRGTYSDTDREFTSVSGVTNSNKFDSNGYTVTLTQSIYQKANYDNLNQAGAKVSEAMASFADEEQALILRVATQYFLVLAAHDNLTFAKAEKKAISEQLVQSKQRFNVGLTAITDVHEAKARYDQAVASEIEAQNTLSISKETIHEITGKEHTNFASLSKNHPLLKPKPAKIDRWIKTALAKNAILEKVTQTVDVARFEVSKVRSAHFPSLDLIAEYSSNEDGTGAIIAGVTDDTRLTLQLDIPLYQGGLVSSRTRAASYRLQQAKEILERQRRATIRLTRNSYLSIIANISQAKALKQALKSTRTALEATQAGFEVGTRTGVDVLNSQRERYRASRDYARARYNYIIETLQLKYAAGILSQNSLVQINRWLK